MTGAHTVGAVVVNYNAEAHVPECVRSLHADGVDAIVVVDNASTTPAEHTLAALEPEVTVVRLPRNVGYGAGANRGVGRIGTDYVLVTNADTVVEPGTTKALAGVLDREARAGAVGPAIHTSEGDVYPSARTFPSIGDALGHAFLGVFFPRNRFTRRYRMLDWGHADCREVDWVSGASLMVRASAFEEIGGFDESFFMYSEDVDLCWRLRRAGWTVWFEPAGRVVHAHGASTAHHPYRMIAAHHVSLLRFAARSTTGARRALLPLVAVGLALRAAIVSLRRVFGRRTL